MLQVLIFSLIGGVFSLLGGALLLTRRAPADKVAKYAMPFAAGALLAAAFFDLLPDAIEETGVNRALQGAAAGMVLFFMLERFLRWFHHHHQHEHEDGEGDPTPLLVIAGDTLHNFIDGIAIAAAFLVDPKTGIITTIAVAAHEIPQEIGDFGILLAKGVSRRRIILFNVLSALATTVAAAITYSLGEAKALPIGLLLGITAGFFIYIAASDIIPTIHEQHPRKRLFDVSAALFIGAILLVGITSNVAHRYMHVNHDENHSQMEIRIDIDEPTGHGETVEHND